MKSYQQALTQQQSIEQEHNMKQSPAITTKQSKNNSLHIVFCDFDDIKNPLLGAGQAKATLEVGKRLAKKGHTITVLSHKFPGYQDRIENGLHYKHIGLFTKNIRINNILYILTLPFYVVQLKADIVIECFTAPISTLFTPLFTKVPVVALPTSFEAERFSELYKFPFDKIQNYGLRFYKYLMPYTKHMAKKIRDVNSNAVLRVIPEGVDDEFLIINKKAPKHILFLGRFDMGQKGIDLLLKAYALIADKIKYPLVIAGFGPDEVAIKKLVDELGIKNKVRFVGGAYGNKKAKLLSESLFVAFSSRHEGFSLFSLEALASGLPLVGFDIPGLSWAPKKIVLKAKLGDITQYSQLLLKAADNKLNNQMSLDARAFAKNYSWDNVANKFESFFNEVLELESNK
jgi:glycosyltransferase involved in cell wall biosynthesis